VEGIVDRINGGAATAVREALAQKPGALSRKKVVVWACACATFSASR